MNPTTFAKLYSIFSSKQWHGKETHEIVFKNFCELMGNLNEKQQNLMLELSERYIWLSHPEYQRKLIKIFNSIPEDEIDGIDSIILFPIMRPEEEKKTKSAHGILLSLRGITPFLEKFTDISWKEIESFEILAKKKYTLAENEIVFLLDDFLGTGDTIKSTIEKLLNETDISVEKIKVITIASHEKALDYLQDVGVKYYTDIITCKGISDYYGDTELKKNIDTMLEIENLLPSKKFSFGYGESEALITLYRTPNNTFPIFWHDYKKNKTKYKAPFPRY